MKSSTKLVLAMAVCSLLAACGKSTEAPDNAAAPPVNGSEEAPAQKMPTSIVPAEGGVTSVDVLRLAGLAATKAPCSLDLIAGKSVVPGPVSIADGSDILFQGWISNPELQSPGTIAVILSGERAYAIRGRAGGDRPDVAKILKADGLAKSGYNVNTKLVGVSPGEYSISLIQDWNGTTIQCPTKAKIIVTAP